jgi:uncharacterized membrane protein YdjX (TVP38/TMEM64 family)
MPDSHPRRLFRLPHLLIALGLGLVAAIPAARHALGRGMVLLATGQLAQFQQHLLSLGPWAPIVSVTLLVADALIVPLPATIILVANGLVFGVWMGTLVSLVGGLAGGIAAYAIGRYFGRELLEHFVSRKSLDHGDRIMAKYGAWAVILERWVPGIPGDPMSYAAGITRMPFLKFLALTTIGLVPANLVAAFVGVEVAGDVPVLYWFAGWGLVALAWIVWRRFRRKPYQSI